MNGRRHLALLALQDTAACIARADVHFNQRTRAKNRYGQAPHGPRSREKCAMASSALICFTKKRSKPNRS